MNNSNLLHTRLDHNKRKIMTAKKYLLSNILIFWHSASAGWKIRNNKCYDNCVANCITVIVFGWSMDAFFVQGASHNFASLDERFLIIRWWLAEIKKRAISRLRKVRNFSSWADTCSRCCSAYPDTNRDKRRMTGSETKAGSNVWNNLRYMDGYFYCLPFRLQRKIYQRGGKKTGGKISFFALISRGSKIWIYDEFRSFNNFAEIGDHWLSSSTTTGKKNNTLRNLESSQRNLNINFLSSNLRLHPHQPSTIASGFN